MIGPCTGDVWKLIYYILNNKEKFDIKNIKAFVNMHPECRGMLVMHFNKIDKKNIFFENIENIVSSYYTYDNDFDKYKELLFSLKSH